MKRGEDLDLVVEGFALEGKSIARKDGYVVFVRGGVPGDDVRARITRVRKQYAEADVLSVTSSSPARTSPRCRHFGVCGGCVWQHVDYQAQLDFKTRHVADVLERIGGFKGIRVSPALGGEDRYSYRNKMEFSFGTRWLTREEIESDGGSAQPDRFALGLHVRGRYDKVLDLQECFLGSAKSYKIMDSVRRFCRTKDLPVYSPETGSGYLRNLVVRESQRTGDTMVNVVTFDDQPEVMVELRDWLVRDIPGITTLVNNITARKSQVAIGETEKVYLGPGYITEILGGKRYRISANSFFQTNTAQAEVVYETAKRFASLTRSDLVFDLYSGTGGIALFIADDAAEVIGIESVEAAVRDAQRNAALNNVTNCTFVLADAKNSLASYADWRGNPRKPQVVILDPPRSGLHPKIIRSLREAVPDRIVYVSCNPATQARDLKLLGGDGSYSISDIQPVDMFPHTDHIENVVCLVSNR